MQYQFQNKSSDVSQSAANRNNRRLSKKNQPSQLKKSPSLIIQLKSDKAIDKNSINMIGEAHDDYEKTYKGDVEANQNKTLRDFENDYFKQNSYTYYLENEYSIEYPQNSGQKIYGDPPEYRYLYTMFTFKEHYRPFIEMIANKSTKKTNIASLFNIIYKHIQEIHFIPANLKFKDEYLRNLQEIAEKFYSAMATLYTEYDNKKNSIVKYRKSRSPLNSNTQFLSNAAKDASQSPKVVQCAKELLTFLDSLSDKDKKDISLMRGKSMINTANRSSVPKTGGVIWKIGENHVTEIDEELKTNYSDPVKVIHQDDYKVTKEYIAIDNNFRDVTAKTWDNNATLDSFM